MRLYKRVAIIEAAIANNVLGFKLWAREAADDFLQWFGFRDCQQCRIPTTRWQIVDEPEGKSVLCPDCAAGLPW